MTPTTEALAKRLDQISEAIIKGNRDELTMRIPAEPDRDADIVTQRAAARLRTLEAENERLRELLRSILPDLEARAILTALHRTESQIRGIRAALEDEHDKG